jgi:DNA-binding MarR family transcriptional regulator
MGEGTGGDVPVPNRRSSDANESAHRIVESWSVRAGESYGRAIFRLGKAQRCYMDKALRPLGISSAHIPILGHLWTGHDGDTQGLIAAEIHTDPASVTRNCQRLEERGYIRRSTSERDPRALRLSLTDSGWALADTVQSILHGWSERISRDVPPGQRDEILRSLQHMADLAQTACSEYETHETP